MSTTEIGRRAEELAASYLIRRDFTIMVRNWRTRWCELDLVASRDGVIHVIEVKYRRSSTYGYGYDYVNADKRQRLARAAAYFVARHAPGADYQIDIVSVEGIVELGNVTMIENAVID